MVSSPGPMRSPAPQAKETKLPYVLPPGPYSEEKPDCAYAGLIGQAILSSPEHRLTLQDIYEWITTVYPYYKRGEQTWMNSVRHCLSTMVVFRKVPRIRNEGKSLWAIFDEDVPAFANGTFKKSLCADMVKIEKEKQAKRGPRKRAAAGDDTRVSKRLKGEPSGSDEGTRAIAPHPMLPPYFPPFHANPHHQPYYQAYVPQAIPAEVVFPPLPPNMGFARSSSRAMSARPESAAGSSAPRPDSAAGSAVTEVSLPRGRDRSPKPLSSSSSVPALTPNCSSSSSPPLSSHASLVEDGLYSSSAAASPAVVAIAESDDDSDMEVSWLQKGPPIEALAPSALLLKPADFNSSPRSKTKQRDAHRRYKVRGPFIVVCTLLIYHMIGLVRSTSAGVTYSRAWPPVGQTESSANKGVKHSASGERAAVPVAVYASQQTLHAAAQAACHQWRRQALANLDSHFPCRPAHEPFAEPYALQVAPRPAPACYDALPSSTLTQRPRRLADDPAAVHWQCGCPYTPTQDVGPRPLLQLFALCAGHTAAAHLPELRLAMAHTFAELLRCPRDFLHD